MSDERGEGGPGFDPRSSGALVLTCLALVAFFIFQAPGLGGVTTYPELRLRGPTRALLQQSAVERAFTPPPAPWSWLPPCELCSRQGVSDAWSRLGALYDTYDSLPPELRREREGLERARDISLALWGDAESRERVPAPAAKRG